MEKGDRQEKGKLSEPPLKRGLEASRSGVELQGGARVPLAVEGRRDAFFIFFQCI